jgi:hypothetical protein
VILEADVFVAVEIVELGRYAPGIRDRGSGIRLGFGIWDLGFGICGRQLLDLALEAVRGLLNDAQRRAQFVVLRDKRAHGSVVPPLPCEQRLEVPLDLVARVAVPVDGAGHPVDGVDAGVMRFQTERHVPIDVIDDGGVELLLP